MQVAAARSADRTSTVGARLVIARLPTAALHRLGVNGPLFSLRLDDSTTSGSAPVAIKIEPNLLASLYGADYAARVHWLEMPESPPSARVGVPVASTSAAGATVLSPLVSAQPMLLAAQSTTTSADGSGSWGATPLRASSSWQVSAQTGDFSWSYPFTAPPAPAGAVPQAGLSYDAQSVDGETGSTNNQPSDVGEGWALSGGGSIDRSFESCAASDSATGPINGSGDLCWVTDNATVSFAGHSGALIKDAATGQWHLQGDDNTRVEYLTGTSNGTANGDYWRLTTTDGTQYYFGLNTPPGGLDNSITTNSAWTVPVCGTPTTDCHGSASDAAPFSSQAWRWNLDYVVDPNGNAEVLRYKTDTNHYAEHGSGSVAYIRAGRLTQIDYGLVNDGSTTSLAPADEIVFLYHSRCETGLPNEPSTACDASNPTASYWPDVPWDQNCTSTGSCTQTSPTFFSSSMLFSATTKALQGTSYPAVDTWTLQHSWPAPGDGTSAALWMTEIDHTAGTGTSAITTPPTTFGGAMLPNRVWAVDGLAPLNKRRITSIDTDSGAVLAISYLPAECTPGMVPALTQSPQTNDHRCYPAWWTPQTSPPQPAQLDWFHKYVVSAVSADPHTGGGGDEQQVTSYIYTGSPAWRFDTSPGTLDSQRTWGEWAGYSSVEVRTGDPGTPAQQHTTDYTYFQGMDNDPNGSLTNPTSSHRSVQLTASDGTQVYDRLEWAGDVLEQVTRNGSSGGTSKSTTTKLSDTITVPWGSAPTATTSYAYTYTDAGDGTVYTGTLTQQAHHTGTSTSSTTSPTSTGSDRTVSDTVVDRDSFGRPTAEENDASDAGNICTRTSYATNTNAWLLDFPAIVTKVAVKCGATATYPDDAISASATAYDGGAVGDAPIRGNPTTQQVATGYAGDGTPTWQTTSTTLYSALGRVHTVTDPRTMSGTTSDPRVTTTDYTPSGSDASHTGPVTQTTVTTSIDSTNSMQTTTTFDPTHGMPTSVVDQNGDTTTATYDALGRLTQVWLPNRAQANNPSSPSMSYAYTLSTSAPETIATTSLTPSGGTVTGYQLYDGLGRLRQSQSPAEGGGIDLTDTFYDSNGQPYLSSAPYYATGTPSTSLLIPTLSIPSKTETDYDGAGRVTASILIGDSGELATTTPSTELWRTTTSYTGADQVDVTPPAGGVATRTVTNSRGETTAYTQAGSETTTYSYYPSGAMKSMTDPTTKNVWTWNYDPQGRVVSASDPDTGTTTTQYWPDGDLKQTSDNAGNKLYYTYDKLDRQTAEYAGTSTAGIQLASWGYDQAYHATSTTVHEIGQPSSAISYVGGSAGQPGTGTAYAQVINNYNTLDQPTNQTTTIGGSTALAGSYTTSMTYAADGSPKTQTDPTEGGIPAETLSYGYDSLGNPTGLSSALAHYLSSVTYTHLGQVGQTFQSEGAEQWRTYTWDTQTLRLNELFDQRYATANATVSDDTYTYDNAGKITEDSNRTEAVGIDTQCYRYDNLNNLTQAWTPASNDCSSTPTTNTTFGGPAPYWTSYTTNTDTGNRATATNRTISAGTVTATNQYTYGYPQPGATPDGNGNGGPHAVATLTPTTGSALTYSYNKDGATTALPGHTIHYNSQGLPDQQTIAGQTETDLYDANGNLLLETDPTNGTTAYLGDTQLHVAAGSTGVTASRTYTALGQPVAERDTTAGVTGSSLYFLDTNTQNTGSALLETGTAAVTRRYFDPFGNLRSTNTWPNPTTDNHAFLNQPQDLLTTSNQSTTDQINQLGARQYDPTLGRFLSADPVLAPGNPQSINGYAYANNDPVNGADPNGQYTTCGGSPCPGDYNGNGSLKNPVCTAGCDIGPISTGGGTEGTTADSSSPSGASSSGSGGSGAASDASSPGPAPCSYDAPSIWDDCTTTAHSDLATWTASNTESTNDPNHLAKIWHWYILHSGDYWNPSSGDGPACFGQAGCAAAYHYLITHGGDPNVVAKSKIIAATYCVQHFSECEANAEVVNSGGGLNSIALVAAAGPLGEVVDSIGMGVDPGAIDTAAETAATAIPKESQEVIQSIRESGVIAQGGVRGPAVPEEFANDGRNGSPILPRGTASDPITYREWGTIPDPANPKPGGERIVTGSDGSAYYSPDHYKTFIPYP